MQNSVIEMDGALVSFLEVKNITKTFRGLTALGDVSFNVDQGEIVGLIGPNGSGKTTLFNIITGFLSPTKGRVVFKEKDISGSRPNRIAGIGIGRVFQHSSFFPNLSVKENVFVGRHLRTRNNIYGALFNSRRYLQEEKKNRDVSQELLSFVGLKKRSNVLAKDLSYGEQRVLEFAIALAAEPELLLLDEPATGMNSGEVSRLMELIRSLQESGLTVLVVEHNMGFVLGISTRIVVISFGVKIAEGTPEEIVSNDEVITAYLGKSYAKS